MRLVLFPLMIAATALIVACSPKKAPKPDVSAGSNAAFASASEGSAVPPATAVDSPATPRPAADAPLPVIGPAPAWKLHDLNGNVVSLDDFKGKVVVLDFWATWCPPCREEIPGYVDLYRKYGKDRLVIVGVSMDEAGPKVVQEFVKKFGVNYPVVMADDAIQSAYGGLEAIPTTFLIDQKGQIRDKKVGAEPTDEYEKKIKALL